MRHGWKKTKAVIRMTQNKVFLGNGYDRNGDEQVCIPRDYFGANNVKCERCGLRRFCFDEVSQDAVDIIVEKLAERRDKSAFWEEYGEELYE